MSVFTIILILIAAWLLLSMLVALFLGLCVLLALRRQSPDSAEEHVYQDRPESNSTKSSPYPEAQKI